MLSTNVREIRSKEFVFGFGTKGLVGERRDVGEKYGERCLNMEQLVQKKKYETNGMLF